jgi:maltooligosyltrehalose trehalohydrolase
VENLSVQLGRHLFLIAESDLNDPRLLWSRERGGFQLAAQWSDDFHHALHTVLTGERAGYYSDFGKLADVAKALRNAFVFDGVYSAHRRRVHGRPAHGMNGRRFLGYLQNHDQIGNRAMGDRSSRLMSLGRLKIGAALVLTSPFVPMLFQGEEWAAQSPFLFFTDHQEPELARGVREGRCKEFAAFGWKPEDTPDPQARETFVKSKLDWTDLTRSPHRELLQWHQQLIQLRRTEPVLAEGDLATVRIRFDESQRWLVMERGAISVACNLAPQLQPVPLGPGAHQFLLASEYSIKISNGAVELPPDAVMILKRDG